MHLPSLHLNPSGQPHTSPHPSGMSQPPLQLGTQQSKGAPSRHAISSWYGPLASLMQLLGPVQLHLQIGAVFGRLISLLKLGTADPPTHLYLNTQSSPDIGRLMSVLYPTETEPLTESHVNLSAQSGSWDVRKLVSLLNPTETDPVAGSHSVNLSTLFRSRPGKSTLVLHICIDPTVESQGVHVSLQVSQLSKFPLGSGLHPLAG